MSNDRDLEEFGKRAGDLLRASADGLDGATRATLARARARALESTQRPRNWLDSRYLLPAGALASAALAAVLLVGRGTGPAVVNDGGAVALYDLDLLADADALELGQEADLEFIEWAAAMGEQGEAGG
jgi:hypothetical protein